MAFERVTVAPGTMAPEASATDTGNGAGVAGGLRAGRGATNRRGAAWAAACNADCAANPARESRRTNGDGTLRRVDECMMFPLSVACCVGTRFSSIASNTGLQKTRMRSGFSRRESHLQRISQDRNSRDAQAEAAPAGGGRVKRANVLRAEARTTGAPDSSTATTAAAGTGAGVCTRCTVT